MKEEDEMEIRADTPIGRLAAKGVRVSDLIGLISLLGIIAMCFGGFLIYKEIDGHEKDSHQMQLIFANAIRESTVSLRMQTCIFASPQEKREQEYMSPNSFCRQMASIPVIQ